MYAYHHFINRRPARDGRVYSVWVQQNLLGEWTLVRVRGGRQREPVLHSQVVESQEEGERLVAEWVKLRLRHGYTPLHLGNAPLPSDSDHPLQGSTLS